MTFDAEERLASERAMAELLDAPDRPTAVIVGANQMIPGALHAIIDRHLGDPFFGIFLNPGHQIHLPGTDRPRPIRAGNQGEVTQRPLLTFPPGRLRRRQPAGVADHHLRRGVPVHMVQAGAVDVADLMEETETPVERKRR